MFRPAVGGDSGSGRLIHTILVVEDERHITRLIQVNLERAGYEVTCAFNALEALSKLQNEEFDFIIIDVTLPDMNGFELTKILRKNPKTDSIPIMLLLTIDTDIEKPRAIKFCSDCYLTKPFNPMEMLRMIEDF